MKYYVIHGYPLFYIDNIEYSPDENTKKFKEDLQRNLNEGEDFWQYIWRMGDNLGIDIYFGDQLFKLKAYAGAGKNPWHFIRRTPFIGGFVLNNEVKELLTNFPLPKHNYYELKCAYKEQYYTYWWLRINTAPAQALIDFKKSIFQRHEGSHPLPENYNQQAQTAYEPSYMGEIVELYMKKEIEQYDFFFITHYPQYYIVSEKLKQAMEKAKFKGMKFEEATWLKICE